MGAAVQFVGKQSVLKAFEKKDCLKWSLWCGKEMLTCYEGSDETESRTEFEEWLGIIRNNTTAIHSVRFYDDHLKKIVPTTAHVTSFGFRMADEQAYHNPAIGGIGAVETLFDKITARMDKFETALQKVGQSPAEEKLETWEKLLDHPVIMAGIGKMFDLDVSGLMSDAAKISGVPESFDETIATLRKHDEKIDTHLHKLAMIAEKKPQQFKFLIGMLESMVI